MDLLFSTNLGHMSSSKELMGREDNGNCLPDSWGNTADVWALAPGQNQLFYLA